MQRTLLIALAAALCLGALAGRGASSCNAAVFQYALDFEYQRRDRARTGTAHLWVPTQREYVRGVIVAGLTSMERRFVKDPNIRNACEEEGLALLFVDTGLRSANAPELLKRFADKSGYRELILAPLMFVGHSAGGPQARDLAARFAQRCFGLIQHRGGLSKGVPAEVPALASVGQFDEFGGLMRDEKGFEGPWERPLQAAIRLQKENPGKLASFIVDAGAGHFAFSREEAEYMAMFIRKAADARIPDGWPQRPGGTGEVGQVVCVDMDPKSGWLTDLDLRDPDHAPAPYERYGGDPARAAWHFDEKMARATVAFHAGGFGGRDQFITWADRHWVDGGARIYFIDPNWVGDGQTFEVHPVYRETYPKQHNGQGPRWLKAGEPVGHSGAPIRVRDVNGPLEKVGERRLRMKFDSLNPAGERIRGFFIAYSEGDDEYRYTEHVGMLPRGFRGLSKGKDQEITFPPIDNVSADAEPMKLKATSNAGLPVEYYVDHGPAKVVDGTLVLTQVPPRANFPIRVKVTAYQFGSGVEPRVKTAEPVSRTFLVTE